MTLHHVSGPSCPACEYKLGFALPVLQDWFHRVKAKYANTHISWSFRGKEDQEQAFLDGKTKLHFPNSAHNKTPARALDLFQLDEDGVARWSVPFFSALNAENEDAHEDIFWGGKWQALGDDDHFQYNGK